jgi:hypothetical protein
MKRRRVDNHIRPRVTDYPPRRLGIGHVQVCPRQQHNFIIRPRRRYLTS